MAASPSERAQESALPLAAGQTTKSAQAEVSVLARELELAHTDTNKEMGETLFTFAPVPGPFRG